MQPHKARIRNGQVVFDEPVELEEGAALTIYFCNSDGDSLSDGERAELHRALERGIAQADAGELIDADEVFAELERDAERAELERAVEEGADDFERGDFGDAREFAAQLVVKREVD